MISDLFKGTQDLDQKYLSWLSVYASTALNKKCIKKDKIDVL